MTNNKRKAVRLLTNVKVDEISAVDHGAGEGVRIMMMKRASNAAFAKATARLAESVKSIVADSDCDKNAMLAKTFAQYQQHLDGLMKRYPKTANLDVSVPEADPEDGMPDRDDDADETERLSDEDEKEKAAMTRKLKSLDAVQICKQMVAEDDAHAMSEHDLVALIDTYAKAHDTTFAKMFSAQDETGLALRKAVDIAKNAQFVSRTSTMSKSAADGMPGRATLTPRVTGGRAARAVDNPRSALDELQSLVDAQRAANPAVSESEAWLRVYEHPDNRELAQRERQENRPVATGW